MTSAAMLDYFRRAGGSMPPFLRDRPLVLHEAGRRGFVREAPPT